MVGGNICIHEIQFDGYKWSLDIVDKIYMNLHLILYTTYMLKWHCYLNSIMALWTIQSLVYNVSRKNKSMGVAN